MAGMMECEDNTVNTLARNMFWMFQKVEENIMMEREMEQKTKKDPNGTSTDEK